MIIVSACLAGLPCRYDGRSSPRPEVMELVARGEALPVCPEQLGGLATPREPVEWAGGKALTKDGIDCTAQLQRGAEIVAELAKLAGVKEAILKENSPSCGVEWIYDGSFSGRKLSGQGLTTQRLRELGVSVRGLE